MPKYDKEMLFLGFKYTVAKRHGICEIANAIVAVVVIVERTILGCTSNQMRIFIRLTEPFDLFGNSVQWLLSDLRLMRQHRLEQRV